MLGIGLSTDLTITPFFMMTKTVSKVNNLLVVRECISIYAQKDLIK